MSLEKEDLPKCHTCEGKKVNTRGQRCLDCNGTGIEERVDPDEDFVDEFEDEEEEIEI